MRGRPFLIPPKAETPHDRLRYWARAKGVTLTELGKAMARTKHEANGKRPFYRKHMWPDQLDRAAAFLELPEEERKLLHRLAARMFNYDV